MIKVLLTLLTLVFAISIVPSFAEGTVKKDMHKVGEGIAYPFKKAGEGTKAAGKKIKGMFHKKNK